MAITNIFVVDDFYDRAQEIRSLALGLKYVRKKFATYPGREAIAPGRNWAAVRNRLRARIEEPCDAPCPKENIFPQGKFRLALKKDQRTRIDGVHQDVQKWSGVIYLTPDKHCAGGVAFYRHRKTRATSATPEWERKVFAKALAKLSGTRLRDYFVAYGRDMSNWDEIGQIPMKFNRAVILMAHCFHGSTGVFGDSAATGRLTQHFEFYT